MPIYTNSTSATISETIRRSNGSTITYTIEAGKAIETEHLLSDVGLTETTAAPYFNPLQATTHTVTSTGSGDPKTVTINLNTDEIAIWNANDIIVTVYLRSTSNAPPIFVHAQSERIVSLDHNANQVILQFPSAATVYVEERK